MFKFEQELVHFDFKELFKDLVKKIPLYIFLFIWLDTIFELYMAKHEVWLMEE
jgi:hypothetical protein